MILMSMKWVLKPLSSREISSCQPRVIDPQFTLFDGTEFGPPKCRIFQSTPKVSIAGMEGMGTLLHSAIPESVAVALNPPTDSQTKC